MAHDRVRTAILVAVILAALSAARVLTQSVSAFRVGVDLVSLSVTVTPTKGSNRPVAGLEKSDFTVLEDGVPQSLVYFSAIRSPIALSLLIDTSASMEGRLGLAQEAAIQFTRQIRPDDLVQVIDFDSRVQISQDFTSDRGALETAVRATQAGGSTSLYNAVYIALRELQRVLSPAPADQIRRHAIVLLSDGDDTSSLVGFDEVLDQVKRSNVGIYVIGLRSPDSRLAPTSEGDFVLRQFAQQTGGRAFFPQRAEDLAGVYAQVAEEIASQYVLGYVPGSPRAGTAWRNISVRVAKPDCLARTRTGYFASAR
jgi:Ca-activated chloride channel homolog